MGHRDFLDPGDTLGALAKTVSISNFLRYHRLAGYLSHYTKKMQGIALGIPSLRTIFDEQYYTDLAGGLLESLGRLFKGATKLYVYPYRDPQTGKLITAETMEVAPHLRHTCAQLRENRHIETVRNYNERYLPIYPHNVLALIQGAAPAWEKVVPAQIVEIIKRDGWFDWK